MEEVRAALARGDTAEATAAALAWVGRGRGLPRGLWALLGAPAEPAGGAAAAAGVRALAVEQHPGDTRGWASLLRSLRAVRDCGDGSGDILGTELPGLDEAQEAAARAAGRDASVAGAALWREILEDWRARGSADQGAVREAREWHLRRLAVPGQGLESDLEEYVRWEEGRGEPDAAEQITTARKMCKAATESFAEVRHLEENVTKAAESLSSCTSNAPGDQHTEAEEALLRAYRLYSGVYQRAGDLAGARAVWERSVAEVATRPALWREYARFLESSADAGQDRAGVLGDVFQIWMRATEHCWDSGPVLATALRAGERFIHSDPLLAMKRSAEVDAKGLLQRLEDEDELRALGNEGAVEALLASLDPLRRALSEALAGTTEEEEGAAAVPFENPLRPIGAMEIADLLRKAFEASAGRLMRAFPESHLSGPSLAMFTYWARCEARLLGDPIAGREVWARILGHREGARPSGEVVTGAARFEGEWGDVSEARLLFKRFFQQPLVKGQNAPSGSSSSGLDEEGLVLREWLELEREHGSAEDYAAAAALVEPRLDALEALRRKHDAGVVSRGGGEGGGVAEALLQGRKRPRSEAEAYPTDTLAASRHPVFDDRLTVFVKNVPFAYDQAGFRAIFREIEGVGEARLVLDRNSGRSRGFGYVTFSSRAGLEAAVALNGTKVGGKELYVAASKPPTGPRSSGADRGGRGRGGSRGGSGGGRGRGARGRGARGRGGVFVPRAGGAPRAGLGAPSPSEPPPPGAPKSNDDFRKMFLPASTNSSH